MLQGFFTPGEPDTSGDPDERARKRRMAEAMMMQGMDYSPVKSWTQGASRLAQALVGGYESGKYDREQKAADEPVRKVLDEYRKSLLGGSPPSMSSAPAQGGAAPVASGGGSAAPFSGSQSEFVSSMMPHAMKVSEQTGLDPRLVIAQSALETGWGKSAPGNNFFGIKSHGQSGGNTMPTTEVINGQPVRVNDSFRAYAGMGESAADYAAFLKANPRYRGVLGAQGLDAQIEAMAGSGYATDPNYGAKLRQIAAGMQTPDGMPTTPVPSNAPPMAYAPGQQAIAGAAPQTPPMPPQRPGAAIAGALGGQQPQPVTSPPIPQPDGSRALLAAALSPGASPRLREQAMQIYQMTQRDEGVTTVDLGDRIALMNKRGQVTGYMPKTQAPRGPMALGPDQRLVDPATGKEIAGATEGRAPTTRVVKQADGSEVALQWDGKAASGKGAWVPLDAPQGGNPVANPKLTEGQSKDLNYALRGEDLLPLLEEQDKALTEFFSANASKVPVVGNLLKSDQYRQAEQTGRELLAAILRKDTGAAVTEGEMSLYSGMYLPQPGDDQKTIEQKRAGRSRAIEGIKLGIGPARILLEQRKSLDSNKPKADAKDAAPARKTLGGKTYEKRGSDWFEVQ